MVQRAAGLLRSFSILGRAGIDSRRLHQIIEIFSEIVRLTAASFQRTFSSCLLKLAERTWRTCAALRVCIGLALNAPNGRLERSVRRNEIELCSFRLPKGLITTDLRRLHEFSGPTVKTLKAGKGGLLGGAVSWLTSAGLGKVLLAFEGE